MSSLNHARDQAESYRQENIKLQAENDKLREVVEKNERVQKLKDQIIEVVVYDYRTVSLPEFEDIKNYTVEYLESALKKTNHIVKCSLCCRLELGSNDKHVWFINTYTIDENWFCDRVSVNSRNPKGGGLNLACQINEFIDKQAAEQTKEVK